MVIYFDLKMMPQKILSPCVHQMENDNNLFFICRFSQIVATQCFASKGHRSIILCENYT
jgi:hypothetical protein